MVIAVLSDIHANVHALDAVLARLREENVRRIYVLGDIVGYGAHPEDVIGRLVTLPDAVLLAGNHDLAACGRFDARWFNSMASAAIRWTADELSKESLDLLAGLEAARDLEGEKLVHGSVVDPVAEYIIDRDVAAASFDAASFRRCFYGHTHLPALFERHADGSIDGRVLHDGERVTLDASRRYLLNPGSVGQPRDGDARASFMLFDTDTASAVVQRVAYDVEGAAASILEAGLPGFLADRLSLGR